MTRSVQSRVERLEKSKPSDDEAMKRAIRSMPSKTRRRGSYLATKNALKGSTDEEYMELIRIEEQFGVPRSVRSFSGVQRIPDFVQEGINDAAIYQPELREFANERTWAGSLRSPSHCAHWWGMVSQSDLPPDVCERAAELLRQRRLDYRLDRADVDWLCEVLENSGLDLGPEGQQPWLREHLDGGDASNIRRADRVC